jgi:hypothetical protein
VVMHRCRGRSLAWATSTGCTAALTAYVFSRSEGWSGEGLDGATFGMRKLDRKKWCVQLFLHAIQLAVC